MSSFSDWLQGSWEDFRRRWGVLLAVAGLGGAATLLAGFLPLLFGAAASLAGLAYAPAVWIASVAAALIGALWVSTWAQAALMRAAATDEPVGACLERAWGRTGPFAEVLCLVLLAVVGGYFLLFLPGLILSVLLFAAPFSAVLGEAEGFRALGLSWARVWPRLGAVALRLFAAGVLTAAPGYIPYVGWVVMLFWAPFGVAALARLAADLRKADPAAEPPRWIGTAVGGLSAVALVGCLAGSVALAWVVKAAVQEISGPGGYASRVHPETAQALLDAFAHQAPDDEKRKLYAQILDQIKTAPPGAAAPGADAPLIRISTVTAAP
jgi:hypothetical protein